MENKHYNLTNQIHIILAYCEYDLVSQALHVQTRQIEGISLNFVSKVTGAIC